ncbi:MAG: BrnT family toxin [Polyangiaceae bacterium]
MAYASETRFEWDAAKERVNVAKHGVTFSEALELLTSGQDFLEICDADHSVEEDRLIAIGPIRRGIIVVVFTERAEDTVRIISARLATVRERALYLEAMEKNE